MALITSGCGRRPPAARSAARPAATSASVSVSTRWPASATAWPLTVPLPLPPALGRGTQDYLLIVPCPFCHNLPRLSPQNLYRTSRNFEGETRDIWARGGALASAAVANRRSLTPPRNSAGGVIPVHRIVPAPNTWTGVMESGCNHLGAVAALAGGVIPYSATFLNFIGYALGAVRISALSKFQVRLQKPAEAHAQPDHTESDRPV